MSSPAALLLTIVVVLHDQTVSFKTLPELKKQYEKVEHEELSAPEVLVGKAMDFMHSNRSVIRLLARELWDVSSRAIDKIVQLRGDAPANSRR